MTQDEFCDEEGSRRISKMIADYWAARGHKVQFVYLESSFLAVMRSSRVDVRSTMINGYPRSLLNREQIRLGG